MLQFFTIRVLMCCVLFGSTNIPTATDVFLADISKQASLNNKMEHQSAFNSGFFFGERSTSFTPSSSVCYGEENGNVIEDVYGIEMKEIATSQSEAETAPSQRATAKRIDKVGFIAQNFALAHVFDSQTDNFELIPNPVQIEASQYIVDGTSPVQIDIKWTKPDNAYTFKYLTYKIDARRQSGGERWTTVGCVRHPVFRVYHTDDKLFIGKVRLAREVNDVIYLLRCQVLGELNQNHTSYTLTSEWSSDVSLIFRGYQR